MKSVWLFKESVEQPKQTNKGTQISDLVKQEN